MRTIYLFCNIVAASIAAAAVTGAVSQTILIAASLMIGGSGGTKWQPVSGAFSQIEMAALVGAMFGFVPAAIVILLSRARYRPWRAFPVLLIGALLGFVLLSMPLVLMWRGREPAPMFGIIGIVSGPVIGATIAAHFLGAAPRTSAS